MSEKSMMLMAVDNKVNRELLADVFSDSYLLEDIKDWQTVPQIIRTSPERIGGIFISVEGPGDDSYKLLQLLDNQLFTKYIPVVVFQTHPSACSLSDFVEHGAAEVVSPNMDKRLLEQRIKNAIDAFRYKDCCQYIQYANTTVIQLDVENDRYYVMQDMDREILKLQINGTISGSLRSYFNKNVKKEFQEDIIEWFDRALCQDGDLTGFESVAFPAYVASKKEYQWYKASILKRSLSFPMGSAYVVILKNLYEEMESPDADALALKIRSFQEENRKLRQQAQMDLLTGVYNKITCEQQIKDLIMEEPENFHGMMIIDFDNFKWINDRCGHSKGDKVLTRLGEMLNQNFRESDVLGRIGGDEFIIFMVDIPGKNLLETKAQKLIEEVKSITVELETIRPVSISIGIAVYPNDGNHFERLYNRADQALYVAKNFGKNQYRFYEDCVNYLPYLWDHDKKKKDGSKAEHLIGILQDIFKEAGSDSKSFEMLMDIAAKNYRLDSIYVSNLKKRRMEYHWPEQISGEAVSIWENNKETFSQIWRALSMHFDWTSDNTSELEGDLGYFFAAANIKAIIISPVFIKDEFYGAVMFADKQDPRVWTEDEKQACRTMAQIVSRLVSNQKPAMGEGKESAAMVAKSCLVPQNMMPKYEEALRSIYDELYEFNISENYYRIIYHSENKYVTPKEEGYLLEAIDEISKNMIYPSDKQRFLDFFDLEHMRSVFKTGQSSMIGEFRKLWKDGKYHWASLTVMPLKDSRIKESYLCFVMDVSNKKALDEIVEQNYFLKIKQMEEERYHIIVEQSGMIVLEWNCENDSFYFSKNVRALEFSKHNLEEQFRSRFGSVHCHPEDEVQLKRYMSQFEEGLTSGDTVLRLKKVDGKYIWCRISVTLVKSSNGNVRRIITTILDVDEEVRTRKELTYRAEYDPLTGIYNQVTFESRVSGLLSSKPDKRFAIVRVDINRFKLVNDIYGMETGNKLLIIIAEVLKQTIQPEGICGRVNSDVFDICLPYNSEKELIRLTRRITKTVGRSFPEMNLKFSFGICLVEDRDVPVNLLCDRAYLALKSIKGNVVENWAFFTEDLREKAMDEQKIESEMADALANGEFLVYMQPKYDIKTKKVVGAESLVRWRHPEYGILAPARFISLFEKNGFIVQLDEYVWEETCRILRSWMDKGYPVMPVSVNFSRVHLYERNMVKKILEITKKYQVPTELLILELTETVVFENVERLIHVLDELHSAGFLVSMDDFGSGFSSLNMLKDVSIDELKLDRVFLSSTQDTKRGKIIIENVIGLAKNLELKTVAEGVESYDQLTFLENIGCDVAQGYFFSRPIPEELFEKQIFGNNDN